MINEQWKDLSGFDGVYQISDHGRTRRTIDGKGGYKAGHIHRPCLIYGYHHVVLPCNGKPKLIRIHCAVLTAFVGPKPAGCTGSHLNGIRTDNRVSNLCWETSGDNNRRKLAHGTLVHGEKHKCSKLKEYQVKQLRAMARAGASGISLAKRYGVSNTTVCRIIAGKSWPHAGQLES